MIMSDNIVITKTTKSKFLNTDFDNLKFGRVFSDHMLEANLIMETMPTTALNTAPKTTASPKLSPMAVTHNNSGKGKEK